LPAGLKLQPREDRALAAVLATAESKENAPAESKAASTRTAAPATWTGDVAAWAEIPPARLLGLLADDAFQPGRR
jgi:hypothetical protein